MGKIILFARVSTVGQDLTQQTNELKSEALKLGYSAADQIIIEYKESGISLDTDERKGIAELFKQIENDNNIDCVLIYEISRLSRRPKVLYEVRDWLVQRHINLCCLKPAFRMLEKDGTMSQTAMILFSLFSSISESEMMIKKERMLRGRLAKRDRGEFVGGNLLFGYDWNRKTYKIYIREDQTKIVKEFFERYAAGESVRSIMIDLVDRHDVPYADYATACVMGRRMINRSEYAGIKGDTYDYPAIISKELFEKVREQANKKNKFKTRLSEWYWCQKLIYWKDNNCLMSPQKHHSQYKHWDLRTQKGLSINMNIADSIALQTVIDYRKMMNKKEGKKRIEELLEKIRQNHRKVQLAFREKTDLKHKIERINERYINGKMTVEQADKLIDECNYKEKEYNNNINKWQQECDIFGHQIERIKDGNDINYDELTDKQIYDLIREYISKIVVSRGNKDKDKIMDILLHDGTELHYYIEQRGNYPKQIYLNNEPFTVKIIQRFTSTK